MLMNVQVGYLLDIIPKIIHHTLTLVIRRILDYEHIMTR